MITELAERIIELSASYSTDKDFLKKCEITNHSLITELKKGRLKRPGAEILAQIVRGTGCSGTWLLTGQGEMFPRDRPQNNQVAEKQTVYSGRLMQLLRLLGSLEMNKEDLKGLQLPAELSLQAARLTALLLEFQQGSGSGKDL